MAVLEIEALSFRYPGSSRHSLKEITCQLHTGRIVTLLGSNGSGKSTLAKIAAGLLEPVSGTVKYGYPVDDDEWNRVGLLFQNPDEQMMAMDVESEVAWGLENLGIDRPEMKARVREVMQAFELEKISGRPPETLSDGWKQVLMLASLAAMKPKILIFDEPTAFLDPYWSSRLQTLTREMAKSSGILWISTEAIEAVFADEVWLIDEGVIAVQGKPDDVLKPEILEKHGIEKLNK